MLSFVEHTLMSAINWVLSGIITAVTKIAIWFLKETALNPTHAGHLSGNVLTGASQVYQVAMEGYWEFAGLSAALLLASLIWGAYQLQQYRLTGIGVKDDAQSLIGRTVYSTLIIIAGPVMIGLLFHINSAVVTSLSGGLLKVHLIGQPNFATVAGSAVTTGIAAVFLAFFWETAALLVVMFLLWAIVIWFSRQFEIIFWITVWPIAAALAASDPQQRFFNYVKTQVVGLALTQAFMALALYLTVKAAAFDPHGTGGFYQFVRYGVMAAGFYFTSRVPKYWQEANGHSTSGGHELASIAGGYMLGRFGADMLAHSKGGQLMQAGIERHGAGVRNRLNRQGHQPRPAARLNDAVHQRFGGAINRLQQTQEQGGLAGWAAGAALSAGRFGTRAMGGAANATQFSGRSFSMAKAQTAALNADSGLWEGKAAGAAGAVHAEMRTNAEQAWQSKQARMDLPADAEMAREYMREQHGLGSPAGAGEAAGGSVAQDSNAMWVGVQDRLGMTAQSFDTPIIAAANAATPPKLSDRWQFRRSAAGGALPPRRGRYADTAIRSLKQQSELRQAASSPDAAQSFMATQLGYTSPAQMARAKEAPARIQQWLQENTGTGIGRKETAPDLPRGVVDDLSKQLASTRQRLGSIKI